MSGGWSDLRDMELSDDSKLDAVMPYAMPNKPDFPFGLRITLTHEELAKLDLDADCEVGDMLHFKAVAEVTCVSMSDNGNGPCCRVELQIHRMGVIDEDV